MSGMNQDEKKTLYETRDDIKTLMSYMFNDEKTGRPGVIQELASLKVELESVKLQLNNYKIQGRTLSWVLGFLGGVVVWIGKYVLIALKLI